MSIISTIVLQRCPDLLLFFSPDLIKYICLLQTPDEWHREFVMAFCLFFSENWNRDANMFIPTNSKSHRNRAICQNNRFMIYWLFQRIAQPRLKAPPHDECPPPSTARCSLWCVFVVLLRCPCESQGDLLGGAEDTSITWNGISRNPTTAQLIFFPSSSSSSSSVEAKPDWRRLLLIPPESAAD